MQLEIKYFGMLTEVTNCNNENFEFFGESVAELLNILFAKYPQLSSKDFKVAVAQQIVSENDKITRPEIALLPPFSGG